MNWCERGQKCTCFIDRLFGKDWSICCEEHDINYMKNPHNLTKEQADLKFYECLKQHTWEWLALLMYSVVSKSKIAKHYWSKYNE